jgi:thioredoxin-like negative regulator of GroEL
MCRAISAFRFFMQLHETIAADKQESMKSILSSTIALFCCFCLVPSASGKATSAYDGSKTEILPLAHQYLNDGKLAQARNLLNTILVLEPYNADAHLLLGKAFLTGKKYGSARSELGKAEQLAPEEEIASQANQLLAQVPAKFKQPQPKGCIARQDDTVSQSGTILLFTATWQNQFKTLSETIDKIATQSTVKPAVRTILLGEPGNQQMFELFSISELPAIVALNKHAIFVGAAAGQISDAQIRALIKATKR